MKEVGGPGSAQWYEVSVSSRICAQVRKKRVRKTGHVRDAEQGAPGGSGSGNGSDCPPP